jgi:hypothetical protein
MNLDILPILKDASATLAQFDATRWVVEDPMFIAQNILVGHRSFRIAASIDQRYNVYIVPSQYFPLSSRIYDLKLCKAWSVLGPLVSSRTAASILYNIPAFLRTTHNILNVLYFLENNGFCFNEDYSYPGQESFSLDHPKRLRANVQECKGSMTIFLTLLDDIVDVVAATPELVFQKLSNYLPNLKPPIILYPTYP